MKSDFVILNLQHKNPYGVMKVRVITEVVVLII